MRQVVQTLRYTKGTLIAFESGAYSDFTFDGMLVAIVDIDLCQLANEYVQEQREAKPLRSVNYHYGFVEWLVVNQHAMPIDYSTVFLGDGAFDKDFNIKEEPTND